MKQLFRKARCLSSLVLLMSEPKNHAKSRFPKKNEFCQKSDFSGKLKSRYLCPCLELRKVFGIWGYVLLEISSFPGSFGRVGVVVGVPWPHLSTKKLGFFLQNHVGFPVFSRFSSPVGVPYISSDIKKPQKWRDLDEYIAPDTKNFV